MITLLTMCQWFSSARQVWIMRCRKEINDLPIGPKIVCGRRFQMNRFSIRLNLYYLFGHASSGRCSWSSEVWPCQHEVDQRCNRKLIAIIGHDVSFGADAAMQTQHVGKDKAQSSRNRFSQSGSMMENGLSTVSELDNSLDNFNPDGEAPSKSERHRVSWCSQYQSL